MISGVRQAGQFCWTNILSPDPAGARAFFTKVLGWTFRDMPGVGYGFCVGGKDAGGLFDVVSPQTPNGTASVMALMIKVDNADAAVAKIRSLGGTAHDAFDVGNAGRMAVCHDPLGAKFDIWQPKKMQGTEVATDAHGAPSWIENLTSDTTKATAFYSALFGWTAQPMVMEGFTYTVFHLGDEQVAGMLAIQPAMGDGKLVPQWGVYVTVADVDATARLAAAEGGTICVPLQDVPDIGRFCGIVSPGGVMFYAITYEAKR